MWRVRFPHIEFCEKSVFLILNFVKSPFFSHWILWKVRFSNVEFREMAVFLKLNFVKWPKTDSISPLDRSLITNIFLRYFLNSKWQYESFPRLGYNVLQCISSLKHQIFYNFINMMHSLTSPNVKYKIFFYWWFHFIYYNV